MVPAWAFTAFLFLTGVGAIFFRVARDNDDVIRMGMGLLAASFMPLVLLAAGPALPLSLAVPTLGLAAATFIASVSTINPADSLKEFAKTGAYLLLFVSLAVGAGRRAGEGPPAGRRWLAAALGAAALVIGAWHSTDTTGQFALYSLPQVLGSLGSAFLLGGAFVLWFSRGTVRDSMLSGGVVLAVAACVIGVGQVVGLDPLRPWDPRQPYENVITGVPGWLAQTLAAVTGGTLRMENGRLGVVLHRILGIHGNPDFFAPYIMQFVPFGVAVAILDPARRTAAWLVTGALLLTLTLTAVWGGFLSLIMLSPFLGMLLGYAAGPMPREEGRALGGRWLAGGAAAAVLGYPLGAAVMVLVLVVPAWGLVAGYALARTNRERAGRIAVAAAVGGALLAAALAFALHASGRKSEAIEERLVKVRMATEMWRMRPFIGVGVNAYRAWHPRIQQAVRLSHNLPFEALGSSFTQENRTHNDLAQMLGETGVVGTGMFLWLMTALLAGGIGRLRRDSALAPGDRAALCGLIGGVAVILIYMLPNFPFHIVSTAGLFWATAGLLASFHPGLSRVRTTGLGEGARKALGWAAVGTAFVGGVMSWKLLNAVILDRQGQNWLNQQLPMTAAPFLKKSVDLDPFNPQFAYDYAIAHYNAIRTDRSLAPKAEELLKRARSLGFENDDLEYALGVIAFDGGRLKESLERVTAAQEISERHGPSRQQRLYLLGLELKSADAAVKRGQWGKARDLCREALKNNPANFLAALRAGEISVTRFKDPDSGVRELEAAVKAGNTEWYLHYALGWTYALAGRKADAEKALTMALTLEPKAGQVRELLDSLRKPAGPVPPK